MRVGAPAPPIQTEAGRSVRRSEGDDTAESADGPASLIDVRLIANPKLIATGPPMRSPAEARAAAREVADRLRADPAQAARLVRRARPEAASAVARETDAASAERPSQKAAPG